MKGRELLPMGPKAMPPYGTPGTAACGPHASTLDWKLKKVSRVAAGNAKERGMASRAGPGQGRVLRGVMRRSKRK